MDEHTDVIKFTLMRGLILSLVTVSGLLAQTIHITGNYHDLLDNPIDSASVYYFQDDVVVDSTLTSASGAFDLQFTIVSANPAVPSSFSLSQNYPNPFNPSTRIDLFIQEQGSFSIYDIRGALVESLDLQSAGSYELTWGGRNLGAGLYIYVLQSGSQSLSRKMILLDRGDGSGLSFSQASYGIANQLSKPASNDAIRFEKHNTTSLGLDFFTPNADTSLGVINGNVGPRQVQTIRDTVMNEGDSLHVDWNDYFYNDSGTMFMTVGGSPPIINEEFECNVVAFDVLDTSLVVLSNTFSISVIEPVIDNSPPELIWPIPNWVVSDANPYYDVYFEDHFSDPDGDDLTYIINLSSVYWYLEYDWVVITPLAPGDTLECSITATDGEFETTSNEFLTIWPPLPIPDTFNVHLELRDFYSDSLLTSDTSTFWIGDEVFSSTTGMIDIEVVEGIYEINGTNPNTADDPNDATPFLSDFYSFLRRPGDAECFEQRDAVDTVCTVEIAQHDTIIIYKIMNDTELLLGMSGHLDGYNGTGRFPIGDYSQPLWVNLNYDTPHPDAIDRLQNVVIPMLYELTDGKINLQYEEGVTSPSEAYVEERFDTDSGGNTNSVQLNEDHEILSCRMQYNFPDASAFYLLHETTQGAAYIRDNGAQDPTLYYWDENTESIEATELGAKMIKFVYFVNPGTRI